MNAANEMFRAGREHHKSWFQVLRHPDLDLLALIAQLQELNAPKLRDLEDFWVDLMTKRERTLRERLGAWRFLSSEWWALRKYRREGGQ